MRLNFSRVEGINELMPLPSRATEFSAGYDLFVPDDVSIYPKEQLLIKLGIKWKPGKWTIEAHAFYKEQAAWQDVLFGGFFAKIFDKSGLAVKSRFNTRAGVIDMDYPDPWCLVCVNEGAEVLRFKAFDKIAQFVLLPFLVADDLETRDIERTGGFGSTGK